jgi:hypothetical protein
MTMSEQVSDEYFNASRFKVIGTILAAVLAVGALGGIAGLVFDPEPVADRPPAVSPVPPPGGGSGAHKAFGTPAGAVDAGVLTAAAPKGRGKFLQFQNGVQFWLPQGWKVQGGSDTNVYLSDGKGSYAFVATAKLTPKVAASQVIAKNLKTLLPKANYTQLQVSGPKKWAGAFGSVLSTSYLEYISLWVDNQGSAPIYGQIYAGVRNDGMALVVLVEHIPPDGWEKVAATMSNMVANSYARFGGLV